MLDNLYCLLTKKRCRPEGAGTYDKKRIISSYDGSFLNVFYVCELQFYDVFFFYHKAYLVFLLLIKFLKILTELKWLDLNPIYLFQLLNSFVYFFCINGVVNQPFTNLIPFQSIELISFSSVSICQPRYCF